LILRTLSFPTLPNNLYPARFLSLRVYLGDRFILGESDEKLPLGKEFGTCFLRDSGPVW